MGVKSKPQHSFSYATFLVNAVPGIDRQIPFFVYSPRRNLQKIVAELVALQDTYGLSDIILFRSETEIAAVCLRTFPLRRLEKIIAASTSINYGMLLKYKQLFFEWERKKMIISRFVPLPRSISDPSPLHGKIMPTLSVVPTIPSFHNMGFHSVSIQECTGRVRCT